MPAARKTDINQFLNRRHENWRRLEALLERVETAGLGSLQTEEVREFGILYRRASSDLVTARTKTANAEVLQYLNDLVARPTINSTYPEGPNYQTYADRAGNPDLKPELATGVDLSLEHWLPTGGIVSGSAFIRDIKSLIRSEVMLETVSWDTSQRWVSRPRNMEGARTMGFEFEVKARMDEIWEDAPAELQLMLLRFNFALFKSEVRGIPGSNNRLDQQPKGSLNFGADHRWKALGQNFGSGFNFNYVPASRVQQTLTLRREETARRQVDAYLSWASGAVRDGINWRLSMANLIPRAVSSSSEGIATNSDTGHEYLTESWSNNKTFRVISLRADMRF